jgi:hypothetical protein
VRLIDEKTYGRKSRSIAPLNAFNMPKSLHVFRKIGRKRNITSTKLQYAIMDSIMLFPGKLNTKEVIKFGTLVNSLQ